VLLSCLIPVVMLIPTHSSRLTITMLIMIYFGLFMAIANSAFTGFVSSLNHKNAMASFLLGCSTNSLIVLLIEILCLLVFKTNLWTQSVIYFSSTGVILLVMCFCFTSLVKKFKIQEKVKIEWS